MEEQLGYGHQLAISPNNFALPCLLYFETWDLLWCPGCQVRQHRYLSVLLITGWRLVGVVFGFLRSVADFFLHAEILKLYILKKTLSFRDNTKRGSWGERTKRSSSASPCQLSWDLAILLILCFILTYSYDKTFLESVRQNNAKPQIAINIILAALCPVKLTIFSLLDFL